MFKKFFPFPFFIAFGQYFNLKNFLVFVSENLDKERPQWIFWMPIAMALGIIITWINMVWVMVLFFSALLCLFLLSFFTTIILPLLSKQQSADFSSFFSFLVPLRDFFSFMGFFALLGSLAFVWRFSEIPPPLLQDQLSLKIQGSIESIDYPSSSRRLFQRFVLRLDETTQHHLYNLHQGISDYCGYDFRHQKKTISQQDFQHYCPYIFTPLTFPFHSFPLKYIFSPRKKKGFLSLTSRFYEDLHPGDSVMVYGRLFQGKVAAYPWHMGPWDHQQFSQEWARGFSLRPAKILNNVPQDLDIKKMSYSIEALRCYITQGFHYYLPYPLGSVACGFFTGDKSGLPDSLRQDFSQSGLSHLLAIAGLHLSIIMGLFFVLFRFLFSLLPLGYRCRLFLRNIGIPLGLMMVAFFYLKISGGRIPVWRAFFMVVATQGSLIFGYQRHPLYILSLLGVFFLGLTPEWVFHLSFQLSFSAVGALLSFYQRKRWFFHYNRKPKTIFKGFSYGLHLQQKILSLFFAQEKTQQKMVALEFSKTRYRNLFYGFSFPPRRRQQSLGAYGHYYFWTLLRRCWSYTVSGFISSGLIALSTAPLMAFHFHHVSLQGLFSNILAIAWTAFTIFPLGIFALLTLFLPWESLRFFGFSLWAPSLEFLIFLGSFFAQKAQWMVFPILPFPPVFLLCLMGGIFWFFLWKESWRWIGLFFSFLLLVYLYFFPQKPKVFFHSQVPLLGFYEEKTNTFFLSSLKKGKKIAQQWKVFYPHSSSKLCEMEDFLSFLYEEKLLPQEILDKLLNVQGRSSKRKNNSEDCGIMMMIIHKDFCSSFSKDNGCSCVSETFSAPLLPFAFFLFSSQKSYCHHYFIPRRFSFDSL